MGAHSDIVITKFCEQCNWINESWLLRRALFDDNTAEPLEGRIFYDLRVITTEYCLQQIAKLHDPATQSGRINLSLEYIIDYGGWNESTAVELRELSGKMNELHNRLKPARNRLLCHNDLQSILEDAPLGSFNAGMDAAYFVHLQAFIDCVHATTAKGGPFPFSRQAPKDVREFLEQWARSVNAPRRPL